MTSTELPHQTLADSMQRVEAAAAQFEAAQQLGECPAIEAYLPEEPRLRRVVLVELLHADLEFRLKAGEEARVESYLARFPELAAEIGLQIDLIAAEYEFRRRRDPTVSLREYLERFPQFKAELPGRLLLSASARRDSIVNSHNPTLHAGSKPPSLAEAFPQAFRPQFPGYDIVSELGRGGMGVVYRARDLKRRQVVALKTLQWLDAGTILRFKQEFRALADVAHPNLVALQELVSDGERWFFTMELVDGVDFYTYIRPPVEALGDDLPTLAADARSLNALAPEQLQKLRGALVQLTQGLLALQEAGKLHRDIKPRNVLVSREGRVVLLDFGLAADLGRSGLHHSTERHIVGTVSYMSPEQAQALPLSAATDWFSVGVMLYEVLTGQLPKLDRSSLPAELRPKSSTREKLKPPIELVPETPLDLSELCTALLRDDPQERLTGQELLRRLQGSIAPPTPVSEQSGRQAAPFIGREEQLKELQSAFASVRGGQTEVVFVHGRSGTGKSALISHFLDQVSAGGATVVLAGRCYERESVPYKALDSAMDELCRHLRRLPNHEVEALLPRHILSLARVFPVLRRVEAVGKVGERGVETPDPQEVRRRASSALRELLGRLGDRKPLVVYIDDLQWGDADSAEFITEFLRPPDAPAMLFLGSYRAEEAAASPLLAKLRGAAESIAPLARRREFALDTLTAREAQSLALLLLGEGPQAFEQAVAVARESRGNPYFVQELVQYLKDGAGLGDQSRTGGEILLDKMLWERVQRLPEEFRRLLEVLAVAGQPLRPEQASLAAESSGEPRSAITALRSGHLIRASGAADDSRIEPFHDRVRETIVAHLPAERLRQHHLRLAQTLEAAGEADPEMLAIHFQGAGEMERAGECFAAAATNASEALAFDHAARLYRLSLSLRPQTGVSLQLLLEALAGTLANAGRGAEAAVEFLKSAELANQRQALDLRRKAAEQYMLSGHIDEGLAVLGNVLNAVGLKLPATPRQALLSLLANRARLWLRGRKFRERAAAQVPAAELMRVDACWSVAAGLSMVDTIRGADFQTRRLLYSLQAGEPGRIARALSFEAGHLAAEGGRQAPQAETLLQDAEALAERVGKPYTTASVLGARGIVSALFGNWPAARAAADQAERMFREECTGAAWELGTMRRFAFWARIYMGELRELSERVPKLLQDARDRNDLYAFTNLNNVVLPMIYLAADEPDRIETEVYASEPPPRKQEFHMQHYARLLDLSQTDLYRGRASAAWERIESQWPLLSRSFLLRVQQIRIFMHFLRGRVAIMAAGETPSQGARYIQAAEKDARQLAREGMPWSTGLATLLRASLAEKQGDVAAAEKLFGNAAERLDGVSMRLHAAAARRRQGRLQGGDAGQRLIATSESWMAGQTIRNPDRMTNMLAPT